MGWDGAVNARLIAGDIYGMGRSEWLTEAGWRQMYDDGVRTVVDLRNLGERSPRHTDPVVPPEARSMFTLLNCPTEEPDHEEFRRLAGPYMSHPRHFPDNLRLFPSNIVAVARVLAEAQGAVVVHCSAGRDRTGLIATLLLQLRGESAQAIADHYEFGLRGINEWHRISPYRHPVERYISGPALEARVEDTRNALLELVAGLDAGRYLTEHGLELEELERLRRRLH
ncbi:protein-tyrosine-phosphatase [Arthrobacter crystallopoietes BAB-32]|uniref:Protein-tyrosine-phosphatase n=1 Tax=Arthrobacter crystallopoietes BAB-32 TaxID=1246476 RepID=N1UVY5_9MICC|nr:tyrosine-protein phosphatase [Arthrobacter crystallopoietes]EMY34566.1 protein-tyrosine-phosphatase [Arthrobacter crystallopoietes BAB-32]